MMFVAPNPVVLSFERDEKHSEVVEIEMQEAITKKLMSTSILSKDKEETQFANGFVTLDDEKKSSSSDVDDAEEEKY